MGNQSSKVSIIKAEPGDKPVVANLVQLYLYDMTGDLPFPIGRDGKFEYEFLDRFWQHPYLIFWGDELAGFALVINGSPVTGAADRFFMAEFLVLKAYRNRGIGTAASEQMLRMHTGKWQIGVIDRNKGANAFWARSLERHRPATSQHHFDGENWLVYEFTMSE
jgi:predicted acetyltransferase